MNRAVPRGGEWSSGCARVVLLAWVSGVAACCFPSSDEMVASKYTEHQTTLDSLSRSADEATRAQIATKKAEFAREHGALPASGEARTTQLQALNARMYQYIQSIEGPIRAREQAATQADLATFRPLLNGTWVGGGITLTIDPGGSVAYRKQEGATNRTVNGPLSRFDRRGFDVNIIVSTVNFRIDRGPEQVGGVWKMTVDGVELTRQ
ncbi:MAG: hypothetical protein IT379_23730 [Deltaproteobacteria bacterium]|nr:hypothetical protein [Deltaproteobacteria bacterium]